MVRADSVQWEWWLERRGVRVTCPPLLQDWDYLEDLVVGLSCSYDPRVIEAESGVPAESVGVVLAVDCISTQRRFVAAERLSARSGMIDISLQIPAGEVADKLGLSASLVLRDKLVGFPRRVAARRGARLLSNDSTTLLLEGDAGRFPTEAVEFSRLGFGSGPWTLVLSHSGLGDSFMGSVRLMINSEHPVGRSLLDGADGERFSALLKSDLIRLLVGRLSEEEIGVWDEYGEESIAVVMDGMCRNFLNVSFEEAVTEYLSDPVYFEATLQSSIDPLRRLVEA